MSDTKVATVVGERGLGKGREMGEVASLSPHFISLQALGEKERMLCGRSYIEALILQRLVVRRRFMSQDWQ